MLNQNIISKNSTIIIGFSGGPDSIYLLLALQTLQKDFNLTLIAAHLDHQWRQESAQEAEWCKTFCNDRNIKFISKKASEITTSQKYNGSQEAYARNLRRTFFEQLASEYTNSYIALAHHQDDQIETFFIRLARGASIQGLTGIKKQDTYYIRPLLNMQKTDILTYLNDHKITYLKDPSNVDQSYLRNRIRKQLIPTLSNIDHRLSDNIIKTMQHFSSVHDFLKEITQKTLQLIACPQNPHMIDIQQFLQQHPILQQQILLQLLIQAQATFTPSKALFAEIIRFLQSGTQHMHTIHQTYTIKKMKNNFYITQ